jgi:hypothetical protein
VSFGLLNRVKDFLFVEQLCQTADVEKSLAGTLYYGLAATGGCNESSASRNTEDQPKPLAR